MGYYVDITNSTAVLPSQNKDEAYKIMCELNNRNDLKTGGHYPRPENLPENVPNEYVWFSWMDWNYPETCKNAQEILEQLGFECEENDEGDIEIYGYSSKSGAEGDFLKSIGHLLTGEIEWQGECGAMWKLQFGPDGMTEKQGKVVYED